MSIGVLQLPTVKRKTEVRLKKCRYCLGETFQRGGKVKEPLRDNRYQSAQVYRYRGCTCRKTLIRRIRRNGCAS